MVWCCSWPGQSFYFMRESCQSQYRITIKWYIFTIKYALWWTKHISTLTMDDHGKFLKPPHCLLVYLFHGMVWSCSFGLVKLFISWGQSVTADTELPSNMQYDGQIMFSHQNVNDSFSHVITHLMGIMQNLSHHSRWALMWWALFRVCCFRSNLFCFWWDPPVTVNLESSQNIRHDGQKTYSHQNVINSLFHVFTHLMV